MGFGGGEFSYLVDGASSAEFTITHLPDAAGPLDGQSLTVLGERHADGLLAENSPATLRIAGEVVDGRVPVLPPLLFWYFLGLILLSVIGSSAAAMRRFG